MPINTTKKIVNVSKFIKRIINELMTCILGTRVVAIVKIKLMMKVVSILRNLIRKLEKKMTIND